MCVCIYIYIHTHIGYGKVKYLSRAFLEKRVYEKIEETVKVYDNCSFSESLVIDAPSSGMALPAPELVGETTIGVCGTGGIGKTTIMKQIHNELLNRAKFDKVIWVTVSQEFDVFKLQKEIAFALNIDLPEYVLILDDVWKRFFLDDVGIPEPTISNGCKLVLTTRSIELALSMGCEPIRVAPLSEGDALNLFLNHTGRDVYVPTLESTLKQVLEQCAGLPLAIVIIGSSMRGEYDVHDAASVQGMAKEVFERLKFGYDRLPDTKIKHCFLYCALYPQDYEISKEELIEYWIVEGLIDEMETRQDMYDEGLSVLKRLENNCLLESVKNRKCVKMHDLVRDLALHITSESPRYLVKAGMQLEELPNEQEWKEDVEKVSLMDNRIKEVPLDVSIPKCRKLSTLLLQDNYGLERIHESFFTLMTGLKILDLSANLRINDLPDSVFELENLNALLLHDCMSLVYVPSLSKLRSLKKLDLVRFNNLQDYHLYLSRLQQGCLNRYFLNVGDLEWYFTYEKKGTISSITFSLTFIILHISFIIFSDIFIILHILVPIDIQELVIKWCDDLRSLSDHFSSLKYATDLRCCDISFCEGMEYLVSSSSCYNILQSIESLFLRYLNNFSVLFRGERVGAATTFPSPMQPGMFSHLKYITISSCSKIEKLFWPELVHNLQNLEEITVTHCEQLVEVIGTSDDEEENKEAGKDSIVFTLPKLRLMRFISLPRLKCICDRASLMECNSLEEIQIFYCPKLKRIPHMLPQLDNGQLLPPVSLRVIKICQEKWWDSVEWDHPNIKTVL
ncbi:hypothetical protein ACOSQ4_031086 [Xanthoceras sorbifolium]